MHVKAIQRLLKSSSFTSTGFFAFAYIGQQKIIFSQMGRESINDPIVIQSSIALLQERFKQLQRMKEMREERELLRKLAEPKQCDPTLPYEPSRLFFHFLPPRSPPPQVPFSLWSGSQSKCSTTFQCMEAPLFASLFPMVTETPNSMHVSLNKFEDSDCDDVDTSLHL